MTGSSASPATHQLCDAEQVCAPRALATPQEAVGQQASTSQNSLVPGGLAVSACMAGWGLLPPSQWLQQGPQALLLDKGPGSQASHTVAQPWAWYPGPQGMTSFSGRQKPRGTEQTWAEWCPRRGLFRPVPVTVVSPLHSSPAHTQLQLTSPQEQDPGTMPGAGGAQLGDSAQGPPGTCPQLTLLASYGPQLTQNSQPGQSENTLGRDPRTLLGSSCPLF